MTAVPLAALTRRADAWFLAPEPHAAGRMGLYRIVYALIYLWHLSVFDGARVSGLPAELRTTVALSAWWVDPPPAFFFALEAVLVAALVFIAVGWRTWLATLVVLVVGCVREAYLSAGGIEHGNVFLVFYIPLLMLLAGRWDRTHALAAHLQRRAGDPTADPTDQRGMYFVAARAALVLMAALFTTSVLYKCFRGGTWLTDPTAVIHIVLTRNVESARLGYWANPLAPFIYQHPPLGTLMQYGVLAFEGLFFVVLIHRRIRNLYLPIALLFHAANALFMVVSFTPILAAYALFVDWEAAWQRVAPRGGAPAWTQRLSPGVWKAVVCAAALALAATWHAGSRTVFNLGGLIDWRSIWLVVAPLALVWAGVSAWRLCTLGLRAPDPPAPPIDRSDLTRGDPVA